MAFLRSVSRRCCAGKKLAKCGASPMPVVGLLENAAATRTPSLRLVTQVRDTRCYATATAATTAADVKRQPPAPPRQIDPLDLKFNDPIAAFKSKTTMELIRAYLVYQMCSIEYVVENNMKASCRSSSMASKGGHCTFKDPCAAAIHAPAAAVPISTGRSIG
ncbi:Proline oxidase, mitochondrial [Harpegnathos saltator]|uniref:Proline oxidase, mitochondrial n=1 Tax=Harpegnathos saltator TaxID=610380 RepID=E2B4G5_HARSA|nr:Proline oxidase, mitochondrial [Harpegnathos saltator]